MMKRKFLAVFLPIIGTVAVVGSGFSAWYFGSDISTSNANDSFNVVVTDEVTQSGNAISITTNADKSGDAFHGQKLFLDQAGRDISRDDYSNTGIIFSKSDINSVEDGIADAQGLEFEFTVSFDDTKVKNLTLEQVYDAGMAVTIHFAVSIEGGLADYIELQNGIKLVADEGFDSTGEVTLTNGVGTYSIADPADDEGVNTNRRDWKFSLDCSTDEESGVNSLFKWKGATKPTDHDTYLRMQNSVASSLIKFDVKATIK